MRVILTTVLDLIGMILQVGELLEQKQQHHQPGWLPCSTWKWTPGRGDSFANHRFLASILKDQGDQISLPAPWNWGSFIETTKQQHNTFPMIPKRQRKGLRVTRNSCPPGTNIPPKKVEPQETLPCKPPRGLVVFESSFYETSWWFPHPSEKI